MACEFHHRRDWSGLAWAERKPVRALRKPFGVANQQRIVASSSDSDLTRKIRQDSNLFSPWIPAGRQANFKERENNPIQHFATSSSITDLSKKIRKDSHSLTGRRAALKERCVVAANATGNTREVVARLREEIQEYGVSSEQHEVHLENTRLKLIQDLQESLHFEHLMMERSQSAEAKGAEVRGTLAALDAERRTALAATERRREEFDIEMSEAAAAQATLHRCREECATERFCIEQLEKELRLALIEQESLADDLVAAEKRRSELRRQFEPCKEIRIVDWYGFNRRRSLHIGFRGLALNIARAKQIRVGLKHFLNQSKNASTLRAECWLSWRRGVKIAKKIRSVHSHDFGELGSSAFKSWMSILPDAAAVRRLSAFWRRRCLLENFQSWRELAHKVAVNDRALCLKQRLHAVFRSWRVFSETRRRNLFVQLLRIFCAWRDATQQSRWRRGRERIGRTRLQTLRARRSIHFWFSKSQALRRNSEAKRLKRKTVLEHVGQAAFCALKACAARAWAVQAATARLPKWRAIADQRWLLRRIFNSYRDLCMQLRRVKDLQTLVDSRREEAAIQGWACFARRQGEMRKAHNVLICQRRQCALHTWRAKAQDRRICRARDTQEMAADKASSIAKLSSTFRLWAGLQKIWDLYRQRSLLVSRRQRLALHRDVMSIWRLATFAAVKEQTADIKELVTEIAEHAMSLELKIQIEDEQRRAESEAAAELQVALRTQAEEAEALASALGVTHARTALLMHKSAGRQVAAEALRMEVAEAPRSLAYASMASEQDIELLQSQLQEAHSVEANLEKAYSRTEIRTEHAEDAAAAARMEASTLRCELVTEGRRQAKAAADHDRAIAHLERTAREVGQAEFRASREIAVEELIAATARPYALRGPHEPARYRTGDSFSL